MKRHDTILRPTVGISGFAVNGINFFLFQSVWLITVFGASRGLTWPGVAALAFFIAIHARIVPAPGKDFVLMGPAVLIGFVCDSILVRTELLQVTTTLPVTGFAPLWMLILWANLALAINHCLGWLHGRYALAAVIGALGGPLAYLGGAALGAGRFEANVTDVAIPLAIAWFVITPGLFGLAARLDDPAGRIRPRRRPRIAD